MTVKTNPYSTHLPVLRALGRALPIRRVLEFGAGEYSTRLFLDRTAFPDLDTLASVEPDPYWARIVREQAEGDTRLLLVSFTVQASTIIGWDLIFVDNGTNPKQESYSQERVATIEALVKIGPTCPVVIHDYECLDYQGAARGFEYHSIFHQSGVPWTAVCWNGYRPNLEALTL